MNNNSSDETEEVASHYASELPLLYIREPNQGLSRAKNTGLSAAHSKLVIFTDDDVRPYSNWILSYWQAYHERPSGFYFGGPVESEFEIHPKDPALISIAPYSVQGLDWGTKQRVLRPGEEFVSANWACPLASLRATTGFDERLGLNPSNPKFRTGEESQMMEQLKQRGLLPWYLPDAKISHFVPSHKTTRKHIITRLRAAGYQSGIARLERLQNSLSLGSIPIRIHAKLVFYFSTLILAKLFGKTGYPQLSLFTRTLGLIDFLRESRRH